jgi:hypothetical protein
MWFSRKIEVSKRKATITRGRRKIVKRRLRKGELAKSWRNIVEKRLRKVDLEKR